MFKTYKIILILLGFSLIISSCKRESQQKQIKLNEKDTISLSQTITKIYYSLPSPLEIANLVQIGDINFDDKALFTPDQYLNFQTDNEKALALGIYAADLSFCTVFGQQQKSLEYFNVIKKLATDLDIVSVISDSLMNQIEQNLNNVYKLQQIVGEILFKTDALLQDSHRKDLALLVIYSSWVETMHLSLDMAAQAQNDSVKNQIYKIIADEYFVVDYLIKMLQTSTLKQKDDFIHNIESVKALLKKLVKISYKKIYDPYSGKMLKKKIINYQLDAEVIKKLQQKILKIRKNIIEYR